MYTFHDDNKGKTEKKHTYKAHFFFFYFEVRVECTVTFNCGGDMYLHNAQSYFWYYRNMEDICKLEDDSALLNHFVGFIPGLKPKQVQ